MAGERLDFDIFARLREDGFAKAGKAALAASEDVGILAARLDKLDAKTAEARIALKGDKEALAKLDKLIAKKLEVGRGVTSEVDVKGAAKFAFEISAMEAELDKLGKTSSSTTGLIGSGGLAGPSGMGALIAAGVALSPIIATVATGTAGFGLAAAGAVGPVVKAAQATGGLQANMAKLNPEQQKLAQSLLGLGKQYDAFQKSLQPEVLNVFGKGIRLAGHLMHDVQPIAAATGKALGGMLDAIDAEFKSGTWQRFFGFMAANVGPDIQLVTKNFTDLMELLPGLLQDLQPVGTALLTISDNLLKVAAAATKGFGGLTSVNNAASDTPKHANAGSQAWHFWEKAVRGAEDATAKLFDLIPGLNNQTGKTAKAIGSVGDQATAAAKPVFNLSAALAGLTTAMQKNTDQILTSQGDIIGWRQSLQAAEKQLESNSAGLRGNSKDALANKAAVLQSTQQAQAFAEQQTHVGGNLAAASRVIQAQIHWLEVHAGKSKFATAEIHALRMEEQKLHDIRQKIKVDAQGTFKVLPGGTRMTGTAPVAARGTFIRTGQPGVDDQLIIAQRGELVVPTPIVAAGLVDHLRGMIPGFASGGVVSSYSGSVGGMPPWLARQDAATLRALDAATAAATAAGIRNAQASSGGPGMPGPGGGAPSANAALARRLYPPWGSGAEWNAWNTLEMHEASWNQFARNPSSGAYGIPQALPPSKMGAAANPPQSNPTAQIRWMIGYIKGRYGDPINAWAQYYNHPGGVGWYAQGGVVGGGKAPKKHVSKQQQLWLDQLARDVKVLREDQKHAAARRKVLRRAVEIDELWFLTHPDVERGGIGWNEHEKAIRNDRRRLSHFNRRESDKEKALAAKIAILQDLTGHPKGKMYGGPGVPSPDPGAGDGGGGDTGGGTVSAPPAPPPIPPPPMPAWMVAAGLGGDAGTGGGFAFPGQTFGQGGGMSMPEPVTPRYYGGGPYMGYGGGGQGAGLGELIAAIQAMHQGVVGAVNRVAPGTSRGFDRSLSSMVAGVAGRFG